MNQTNFWRGHSLQLLLLNIPSKFVLHFYRANIFFWQVFVLCEVEAFA